GARARPAGRRRGGGRKKRRRAEPAGAPGPPGTGGGGGGGGARPGPPGRGGGGGGGGALGGPPHVHMTDPWGIADGYHDALGEWRVLSTATREALRRAMGAEGDAPPPAPVIVGRAGERVDIAAPARLVLEDGAALDFDGTLP